MIKAVVPEDIGYPKPNLDRRGVYQQLQEQELQEQVLLVENMMFYLPWLVTHSAIGVYVRQNY